MFPDIICCALSAESVMCELALLFPLTQKLAQLQAVVMLFLPHHLTEH